MPKLIPHPAVLFGLLVFPGCTPTEPKATVTTSEPQSAKSSDAAKPMPPAKTEAK